MDELAFKPLENVTAIQADTSAIVLNDILKQLKQLNGATILDFSALNQWVVSGTAPAFFNKPLSYNGDVTDYASFTITGVGTAYLTINYGELLNVNTLYYLFTESAENGVTYYFESSPDNINWTLLATWAGTGVAQTIEGGQISTRFQYLRFRIVNTLGNRSCYINELRVFGRKAADFL
jgi:hypothetical protein